MSLDVILFLAAETSDNNWNYSEVIALAKDKNANVTEFFKVSLDLFAQIDTFSVPVFGVSTSCAIL